MNIWHITIYIIFFHLSLTHVLEWTVVVCSLPWYLTLLGLETFSFKSRSCYTLYLHPRGCPIYFVPLRKTFGQQCRWAATFLWLKFSLSARKHSIELVIQFIIKPNFAIANLCVAATNIVCIRMKYDTTLFGQRGCLINTTTLPKLVKNNITRHHEKFECYLFLWWTAR